jgi:hypothetical protein
LKLFFTGAAVEEVVVLLTLALRELVQPVVVVAHTCVVSTVHPILQELLLIVLVPVVHRVQGLQHLMGQVVVLVEAVLLRLLHIR